jgi:hypothetical protein
MATINQFQQYSQGENTVTNNVLLMFSLLYEINPKYFEEYINSLIDESEFYRVIPTFQQQIGNFGNDGVMDGHISMPKSSIIIETKLHNLEWRDKLLKYAKSFKEDETKILFHLSASKYSERQIREIRDILEKDHSKTSIKFFSITYDDLSSQLGAMQNVYVYEQQLKRLADHFESYCQNMGLLHSAKHILRAMACGQSRTLNEKHQFYFDLAERGYSPFTYLGIYFWKAVRFIGKVENVIVADYDYATEKLTVKESENDVTEAQRQRLIAAILEADSLGWGISENHRFFLLNNFHETYFEKTSPGGIFRVRYFNLEDYLGKMISDDVGEVSEQLKKQTWK